MNNDSTVELVLLRPESVPVDAWRCALLHAFGHRELPLLRSFAVGSDRAVLTLHRQGASAGSAARPEEPSAGLDDAFVAIARLQAHVASLGCPSPNPSASLMANGACVDH